MQTIKFFAILIAASPEIFAESAPSRRLIVNIAARKIVLVEDGKVVKMYPVAVGKRSTPNYAALADRCHARSVGGTKRRPP